ncbi:MAG: hypothetical protein FJW14_09025 [Acidimicrobiia bacterium]|nr:hypothetical protein [Acidimicrobiia bacterium]
MAVAPDRRTFLTLLGLGVVGVQTPRPKAQARLRVGFYLPAERALGQPTVLQALAAIGYRDLDLGSTEQSGAPLLDLRRSLDQRKLAAPSRHVPMPLVFSNWRAVLGDCKILGSRVVVCEVPAAERASIGGYRRVAELLNSAGKIMLQGGAQLAVRVHADDLTARGGAIPFDFLLTNTNPALVKFQAALPLFEAAGRNLVADFTRQRDRFVSVHVANTAAPDLATVLGAARDAGVQHVFVADTRPDPSFDRARESFEQLTELL